jgi:hypothetical protein
MPTATIYPANISVSGLPNNIVNLKVKLKGLTGVQDNFDILLEGPDGTKCILFSDEEDVITFAWYDLTLAMNALSIWPYPNDNNEYHPPNKTEIEIDTWPGPGPGGFEQPYPTLAVFEGKNPNGTWKVYLVDDEAPYALSILGGVDIEITAASTIPCVRPGLVKSIIPQETTALVTWDANGQNNFDLWYGETPLAVPNLSTVPSIANINSATTSLVNLLPGKNYALYVRASCAANSKSAWVGSFLFKTEDDIQALCDARTVVQICDTFFLDNPIIGNSFTQYDCSFGAAYQASEQMFEFTPTVNGTYNYDFTNNISYNLYYTQSSGCKSSDFKCTNYGFIDLVAGVPVKFIVDYASLNTGQPKDWMFLRKPGPQSPLPSIKVVASTYAVLDFAGNDLVYQPFSFQPDDNTMPTESGITTSIYRTQVPMTPNTQYYFWQRSVDDMGRTGCWVGSKIIQTQPYCGKLSNFTVDNITGNSAEFQFESQDILNNIFAVAIAPKTLIPPDVGQNIYTYYGAVQTIGLDRIRLGAMNPSTEYRAYIKPSCATTTDWYGPFDFQTTSKCNPTAITLTETQPAIIKFALDNPSYNLPCRSAYINWSSNNFVRFTPEKTGIYGFCQKNTQNTTNIPQIVHYAIHEIKADCNDENWQCLAEIPLDNTEVFYSDTLIAGKTYLIQITSTASNIWSGSYQTDFTIAHIPNNCPKVPLLEVQSGGFGTANVGWQTVFMAASYDFVYGPYDLAFTPTSPGLNSSSLDGGMSGTILSPLNVNSLYKVWMRTHCTNGEVSEWTDSKYFSTGIANHISTGIITRCSPIIQDGAALHFERLSFTVQESGKYYFWAEMPDFDGFLSLHDGIFNGPDPLQGFIANSYRITPSNVAALSAQMEAGETYSLIVYRAKFNVADNESTLLRGRVRFFVGGPAFITASTMADLQGISLGDHGKVKRLYSSVFEANMGCKDSSGWVHYLHDANTRDNPSDDILLLSIHAEGNNIGNIEDGTLKVSDYRPIDSSGFVNYTVKINNPPALYVTNPFGWYIMNKWWEALPLEQPTSDIKVRYYFEESEFQSLRFSIQSAGQTPPEAYKDLYFYKINGAFSPSTELGHAGIPAATSYDGDGFWQYENGTEASSSKWALGFSREGEPYSEMVIRRFSGGGGGVAGIPGGAWGSVKVQEMLDPAALFRLWPNPTSDVLYIAVIDENTDFTPLQYKLLDASGRICRTGILQNATDYMICSDLIPGLYFLEMISDRGRAISRVIVQR